jgi:hypothetical protein
MFYSFPGWIQCFHAVSLDIAAMKTKTQESNLPPSLDSVANQWREYIQNNVDVSITKNVDKHVPGMHSVYHLEVQFKNEDVVQQVMHYAGRSGDPKSRANKHKSDVCICAATTRTGKSKLYDEKYFKGVTNIQLNFTVVQGGYDLLGVKMAETALSDQLKRRFGEEAVLTSPKNGSEK